MPRYLECLRVTKGLVAWVIEGKTKQFRWSATPALLMADLHRAGVKLRKPPAFCRSGIPGSGGPDWLRNDYEFIVCASHGKLPWSDNTACGHPPKFGPGGDCTNRMQDGQRAKGSNGVRNYGNNNGDVIKQNRWYEPPELANPGNVIDCHGGGGHLGSFLAHENEAPFPEKLAEFFIKSFCPPAHCSVCGLVLESLYAAQKMQSMWVRVLGCPFTLEQQEILFKEMSLAHRKEAEGEVREMRATNQVHSVFEEEQVLQREVFKNSNGQDSKKFQGLHLHHEGIQDDFDSRGPECEQLRVCDGASSGDGKEDQEIPQKRRGRTPQEQEKIRQQNTKFGTIEQVCARLLAQRAKAGGVSALQACIPYTTCPACGSSKAATGLIFDPFSGSGTTIAVAWRLGRTGMGIDIRESQIELGEKRLDEVISQGKMSVKGSENGQETNHKNTH